MCDKGFSQSLQHCTMYMQLAIKGSTTSPVSRVTKSELVSRNGLIIFSSFTRLDSEERTFFLNQQLSSRDALEFFHHSQCLSLLFQISLGPLISQGVKS